MSDKYRRDKKAQMSTVMIILVILVLMVGALFFVRKLLVYDVNPYPVVSPEFEPVHNLVQKCLEQKSKEAIKLVAQQGGYIEIPKRILAHNDAYLEPVPDGLIKIPYWYYKGKSYMPSVEEMQIELNNYVAAEVKECADFSVFDGIYEINPSEPSVLSWILENGVDVELEYPMDVTNLDTQEYTKITKFGTTVDASLKKLYTLAKSIHVDENTNTYLENFTIDLMALDPDVPFTNLELSCRRKTWLVQQVKSEVQDLLYVNAPRVRIDNTNYLPFSDDEEYEKIHMLWNIENDDKELDVSKGYDDITVGIFYNKDWPFGFVVRPRDGNKMYSSFSRGLTDFVNNFCVNLYHFTYDISYPLEFVLEDENSLGGEGLVFNFAEPVIIDHNMAEREQYGINDFLTPEFVEDFCLQKTEKSYDIIVSDLSTGLDIDGANISFVCVNRYCPLGTTEYDNGRFKLTTQLPSLCTAGNIRAEHADYLENSVRVSLSDMPNTVNFDMLPVVNLEYVVYRHTPDNILIPKELKDNQQAFISLENTQYNHDVTLVYPNLYNDSLKLIYDDTNYTATIYLLEDDDLVGGYIGNMTLDYDVLSDSNMMEFNVVELDLDEYTIMENSSLLNVPELKQEFTRDENAVIYELP